MTKKCYRVIAEIVDTLELLIYAESEAEALELAEQVDGSEFSSINLGESWDIVSATETNEEGADFETLLKI